MALIDCFQCKKGIIGNNSHCPYCGCYNFYADDTTMLPAIHMTIDQLEKERERKLRELWWVNFWANHSWLTRIGSFFKSIWSNA